MNIYKYLLIDAALAIGIIPILLLLISGKKKYPLLASSDKEKLLRKNSVKLPEKEKLIELERLAENQGSGIELDSLIGDWNFISVWKKDIDEEDHVFSALLRIFAAKIKFKRNLPTKNSPELSIIASIQLGILTIEFSGSGYLEGKQPLLIFYFKQIKLKSISKVLLSRSLLEQKDKEAIFSLIALEENGEWLSARGGAGALVMWLKD